MGEQDKVRWRCRRGLLELDLILEKFNQQHLENLDAGELQRYQELLDFPDPDLLDLLMSRAASPDSRYNQLLQLLRGN